MKRGEVRSSSLDMLSLGCLLGNHMEMGGFG